MMRPRPQYNDQMRLGVISAEDPNALAIVASPSDEAEPLPFVVSPSGDGVAFRTGISTLNDYNFKILAKQIERAKATAPSNVKLPQALPMPKPSLDVWSSVVTPNTTTGDAQALRSSVGADYKITSNATTGVVAERADPVATPGAYGAVAGDEKLSAYLNFKATPILSVDAKTEWQRTDSTGVGGDSLTKKSIVSIAPKLNRKFDLKDGKTIEPYATVRHELDLGASAGDKQFGQNSVGAGLTFAKPDAYSVTLSTDVDGIGGAASSSTNTKLQFKLPLP